MFYKKGVLKNFGKLGKHLCRSLLFCFEFLEILRTRFYRTPFDKCLWVTVFEIFITKSNDILKINSFRLKGGVIRDSRRGFEFPQLNSLLS